ncbi:putative sulfonate biosynthesis enzyme [Annulohypoxylon bovei var. microspora]|nr:putative sulfonate biosynthesis enzyme [Annulohypoxylon bovei var. microspora]
MASPLRSLTATALRQARIRKPASGAILSKPARLATASTTPSRPFTATAAASSSPSPARILLEDPDTGFGFTRRDRDPRAVLHGDGAAVPGGRAGDDGRARGRAEVRGRALRPVRAGAAAAADRARARGRRVRQRRGLGRAHPVGERVQAAGLKPKPELGIQFGAGGDTAAKELESVGTSDPGKVVGMARRFVRDAGVERVMIESEGITENVKTWRTDVIQSILKELPLEIVMFEAADPSVFNWYIREFGVDVNLFVDHSQIVQLAGLRAGIWGKE